MAGCLNQEVGGSISGHFLGIKTTHMSKEGMLANNPKLENTNCLKNVSFSVGHESGFNVSRPISVRIHLGLLPF